MKDATRNSDVDNLMSLVEGGASGLYPKTKKKRMEEVGACWSVEITLLTRKHPLQQSTWRWPFNSFQSFQLPTSNAKLKMIGTEPNYF